MTGDRKFDFLPISPEWISEKSNRVCGNGIVPGSDNTARKWAHAIKNIIVLNIKTWNGPHKLKTTQKNQLFKWHS